MSLREKVARAICSTLSSSGPDDMVITPDSQPDAVPYWTEFTDYADAALAAMLAELETPSEELVRIALKAAGDNVYTPHYTMAAALQAIATHIRGK